MHGQIMSRHTKIKNKEVHVQNKLGHTDMHCIHDCRFITDTIIINHKLQRNTARIESN